MFLDTGNNQTGTWEATIPGGSVQGPGIDYYITAKDGTNLTSDPSVDAASNPYQFAVLPNQPPTLVHTPVSSAPVGTDVIIDASASDSTNFLQGVDLYYREVGDVLYKDMPLTNVSGSVYQGVLPGTALTTNGAEYYLEAVDNFGLGTTIGTADNPLVISPTVPTAPDIDVRPVTWSGQFFEGDSLTKVIEVANLGNAHLTVTNVFESSDNCATASAVNFLSLSTSVNTVVPGGSGTIDATVDTTGLAAGTYPGSVCIESNDTFEPLVEVPFTIEVLVAANACAPADFNGDGVVDNLDAQILFTNWGQNVAPGTNGDVDGNGFVDGNDYALFSGCFGQIVGP